MPGKTMSAVALSVCVAGVAACGGSSGGGGGNGGGAASSGSSSSSKSSGAYGASSSSTKSSSGGGSAVTIKLSKTDLGRILTDGKGRTLYLFEKDTGAKSTCTSACAQFWPPLVAKGKPKLGSGLSAGMLGTTSRGGGVTQVTFAGHPLYYFAKDSAAGQIHGEGLKAFGAEWYVVSASGKKVEEEGE